jgi:hypothetical protein
LEWFFELSVPGYIINSTTALATDFQKWSIPENTTTDKPVDKPVDKSVDFFVETRKTSQQNKSVVYPIQRIILQQ